MPVLNSQLDVQSSQYQSNFQSMQNLVDEFKARVQQVKLGGGEQAMERHRSRGKLTARERIDALIDPGSAFLELSTLAAWDMYGGSVSSAGVVTGIGVIHQQECMLVANDATVKGGVLAFQTDRQARRRAPANAKPPV